MSYARDQRVDHEKYDQLHDSHSNALDTSIPMDKRDPWDTRMSYEDLQNPHDDLHNPQEDLQNPHARSDHAYGHVRQGSAASAPDDVNESYEQPEAMNYNRRY